MRYDWKPIVHAACVSEGDRFAIAYGEFEYDDPFFVIMDYDGSAHQPWGRRDVRREMSTIITLGPPSFPQARYAGLSREGDVYFIADATSNERITGAGLASPDSEELGEMFDFALVENELWAVGARGQFYRRVSVGWTRIAMDSLSSLDLSQANLGLLVGNHAGNIYITFVLPADEAVIPPKLEKELLKNNSWDEWSDAQAQANATRVRKRSMRGLLHWNGHTLTQINIPLPQDSTIDALYMDSDGVVYVGGDAGVIVYGNLQNGFSIFTALPTRGRIRSITKSFGDIYFLINTSMMKMKNGVLEKINLPMTDVNPLRLCVNDDCLFYFDRRAKVALFHGENWRIVTPPPLLLKRNFAGE